MDGKLREGLEDLLDSWRDRREAMHHTIELTDRQAVRLVAAARMSELADVIKRLQQLLDDTE